MSYSQTARRLLSHFNRSTETGNVYLIKKVVRGGDDTPLNPGTEQTFRYCLTNPVFVSTVKNSAAGRTDIKFDRVLLVESDNEIVIDDILEYQDKNFVVVDTRLINGAKTFAYKLWLSVG